MFSSSLNRSRGFGLYGRRAPVFGGGNSWGVVTKRPSSPISAVTSWPGYQPLNAAPSIHNHVTPWRESVAVMTPGPSAVKTRFMGLTLRIFTRYHRISCQQDTTPLILRMQYLGSPPICHRYQI